MAHAGPEFVGRRFGDGEVRHRPWRLVRRVRLEVGAAITVSRWHEVFTLALTGLGERSHLASARVDLETHIRDVVGMLEYKDLGEVVWWPQLRWHGDHRVADRIPERLAQLGYLDAEVPWMGRADWTCCPRTTWTQGCVGQWCGWSPSRSPPSPNRCG